MCAITSLTDHSPQKPASCISSGATCPTNSSQCALDRLTNARNSDFVMGSTIRRAPSPSSEGWTQCQQVVQIGPPIGHFGQALAIDGDLLFLQPLVSQPLIEPAAGILDQHPQQHRPHPLLQQSLRRGEHQGPAAASPMEFLQDVDGEYLGLEVRPALPLLTRRDESHHPAVVALGDMDEVLVAVLGKCTVPAAFA